MQWCNLSGVLQRYSGRAGEDAGTHDHDTTTAGEPQRESNKEIFCLYIGIIAPNQKYLKKKLRKIWKFNFLPYLCSRNQTTNKYNNKNNKAMKEIVTDNAELLEVLEANGINIICSDDMRMMVTDTDAMRIDAIVADKAPAAFADYIIC